MRLQTQTPLGRMANACRDNFERAQFVGYDPRMVRFFQFALSGFFAGSAAGSMRSSTRSSLSTRWRAAMSANALLMTYIGGVGDFSGPMLGAILIVLLQSGVSLLSNAWLVYVGVLFIMMVMFAPGGMAGLVAHAQADRRSGRLGRLVAPYARMLVPGLLRAGRLRPAVELELVPHHRRGPGQEIHAGRRHDRSTTALPWADRRRCCWRGRPLARGGEGRRVRAAGTR